MKSIRPKPIDLHTLKLSAEEGFVLSRLDGATSMKELVAVTGLDEERVSDIVGRLEAEGAVEIEAPARAPDLDDELRAFLAGDAAAEDEEFAGGPAESGVQAINDESVTEVDAEGAPELEAVDDSPEEAEVVALEQRNERAYRQIYETVYHPMDKDRRTKAASEVTGADLLALCLDADPQIIHAVLQNPAAGLEHARMVAAHHRTQIGLEAVAKRAEMLKDALVQRRLLRNPQLPATILNRMVGPKLIGEVYKIAIDREIPERSRLLTREILRKKFMLSSSDEKASLLFKTEGRCLILLVACSLDAHATQILCAKSTYTMLLIQNFGRWSATPPSILTHMLKMQVVRRNTGLRKMLLKHPNLPSEAKRTFQG